MADHIKIRPATGTWVVRAAGAVLGESKNALELTEGSYYTIEAKSGPIKNAAWSYEAPLEAVAAIKDHIAFYTDKVAVEQV